jgi:septal ring factor EnvC (AmiA/AmiB activator)
VVLPIRDHNHVGCLPDQVRLTHALNEEINQAMKEIHQFGDQREEANRRIAELESLCKQHVEAIAKVKKENTSLELGIQSHKKLIKEMAAEMGLDMLGEANNEDDDDDERDAMEDIAAVASATTTPEVATEEEEDPEMMIPEQETPESLEIILR